jgi:hypothetical protein
MESMDTLKDEILRLRADLEEGLEAVRITQEYIQLPCVDGWLWWEFYKKHRPEDAMRLAEESNQ